jgi:hypothetical protein
VWRLVVAKVEFFKFAAMGTIGTRTGATITSLDALRLCAATLFATDPTARKFATTPSAKLMTGAARLFLTCHGRLDGVDC